MSKDQRTLQRVNREDIPKFKRLFYIVQKHEGTQDKAMKVFGFAAATMYRLLNEEVVTIKTAKEMLRNYKAWKIKNESALTK